jgi:hypothetical protein
MPSTGEVEESPRLFHSGVCGCFQEIALRCNRESLDVTVLYRTSKDRRRQESFMPNYEIYPADIHAVLDVLDRQGGPVSVDSTNYQAKLTGSKLEILRDAHSIGHMNVNINKGVIYLGKLFVVGPYRASGVSNLLLFIAFLAGVRGQASRVSLNEDSEVGAYGFWARFGIQVTAGQQVVLATVLQKFEQYQVRLATDRGLSRTPQTMLLNTDYPAVAAITTTTTSGSDKKRRSSFN